MNASLRTPGSARGATNRLAELAVRIGRRTACAALLLSLCLPLGLQAAANLSDFYISCFDPIGTSNPDWMSWLPDDILLSELSIPATHDTMSYGYTGSIPIPDNVVDQGVNLATQLGAGVRLVDIRCHYDIDGSGNYIFNIAHGEWPATGTPNRALYVGATFTDVLQTVNSFLQNHPDETVIMQVQEEAGDVGPTHTEQDFSNLFQSYLDGPDGGRFWMGDPVTKFSQWPTLGAVRGKIVLRQNFGPYYGAQLTTPFGISGKDGSLVDVDSNAPVVTTLANIQTRWDGTASQPGCKDHLLAAANSCSKPGVMYWTSPNGYGPSGSPLPYTIAGGVTDGRCGTSKTEPSLNEDTLDFLRDPSVQNGGHANQGGHWRTGAIWMDYPGGFLIESIILHNPFVFVDWRLASTYGGILGVPYPVGYGAFPASTVNQAVAAVAAANDADPCVHRFTMPIAAGTYAESVRFDRPVRVVANGGRVRIVGQ